MGRSSSSSASPSSSSCLKMIACGSNTAAEDNDIDDHHTHSHTQPQTKDKRGWSFRKRSARHRVQGNNNTTFTDKEIRQVSSTDFQTPLKSESTVNEDEKPEIFTKPFDKFNQLSDLQYNDGDGEPKPSMELPTLQNHHHDSSAACEKPKVSQVMLASDSDNDSQSSKSKMLDEVSVPESVCTKPSAEPPVTAIVESVVLEVESDKMVESTTSDSDLASQDDGTDISTSLTVDEALVVIVQTAIRGFLAHKGFEQLQSAVKLQAVIRGHLVRRNAVETLHCIQAIAKVQALVRARSSKSLDQNYKPSGDQFSAANLLKNSFARQLLESTPKSKTGSIRCDPLSPNSTWGWLEKWMSVRTCEVLENVEPIHDLQDDGQIMMTNHEEVEVDLSLAAVPESFDEELAGENRFNSTEPEENNLVQVEDRTDSLESKEDDFNQITGTVDLESSPPMFLEQQQPDSQLEEEIEDVVDSIKTGDYACQDSDLQVESLSLGEQTAAEIQQPKLSAKRVASDELNGECKKTTYGSQKSSNPVFVATQSEFEELTSAADSDQPIGLLHQVGAETYFGASSTLEESANITSDIGAVVPSVPQILVAGSECGTELSVSSTLDSPDRYEPDNVQTDPEVKAEEASPDQDCEEALHCETNGVLNSHISDLPRQVIDEEDVHAVSDVAASPVVAEVSPKTEQKAEINGSYTETDFDHVNSVIDENSSPMELKHDLSEQKHDLEFQGTPSTEVDSTTVHQTDTLSSAASPNSHMTVLDSQGTPSSQVSIKSKKKKIDKSGSKPKRTSIPAGKRSPNFDLGVRVSVEHSPKDHKSGKRRNSFGSTKSDATDQEPRHSTSHVSVPSYMQATESARAKAYSPRSSPDVHDKEVNSKKRHSLPGAGGRQGSPRVQRSPSQATQGAKANGSDPSNERKWQR